MAGLTRVVVWCKVCGDVLDTDRIADYAECCCRTAHLDSLGACDCLDPALVDVRTETR